MNEKCSSWPFSFFMTILKKVSPERTAVCSGENCSFMPNELQFSPHKTGVLSGAVCL